MGDPAHPGAVIPPPGGAHDRHHLDALSHIKDRAPGRPGERAAGGPGDRVHGGPGDRVPGGPGAPVGAEQHRKDHRPRPPEVSSTILICAIHYTVFYITITVRYYQSSCEVIL